MLRSDPLESVFCQELARVGTCTLQELNERLPYFSWSEVFSAVNRLNGEGTITLQRPASFEHILFARTGSPGRGAPRDAAMTLKDVPSTQAPLCLVRQKGDYCESRTRGEQFWHCGAVLFLAAITHGPASNEPCSYNWIARHRGELSRPSLPTYTGTAMKSLRQFWNGWDR